MNLAAWSKDAEAGGSRAGLCWGQVGLGKDSVRRAAGLVWFKRYGSGQISEVLPRLTPCRTEMCLELLSDLVFGGRKANLPRHLFMIT